MAITLIDKQPSRNDFYIYRHIRLDTNQPFYIGKGRVKSHRATSGISRTKHWTSIVEKCGYRVDYIMEGLTNEEAIEKEIEFIVLYGRLDLGTGILCNYTDGGEGKIGSIPTEYQRKVLGDLNRGIPKSAETKRKMSLSNKGNQNFLGKKHTEESKMYLSKIHTGKKFSEEHKKNISKSKMGNQLWLGKRHDYESLLKMSNTKQGKTLTDEHKEKIRKIHTGRKLSEEYRKNATGSRKKPVIDTATGIIYVSIVEASRKLNIGISSLRRWVNNKTINQSTIKYVGD